MKTTNYIEGLLMFAAIVLMLIPIQELNNAREVPLGVIVAIGSYGLLLIARRPRLNADEKISTRSRKTAWYLAMTGVVVAVILSHATNFDQSGFLATNAICIVCIYYGLALSMLVFSFINRNAPVQRNEHNYLPKHRFNTLELSI